jgi:hypothetical protein
MIIAILRHRLKFNTVIEPNQGLAGRKFPKSAILAAKRYQTDGVQGLYIALSL